MKAVLALLSGLLVSAVCVLASATQRPPAREPAGIAFVSTQRILAESASARAEVEKFQAARQQADSDLRAKQQALESTVRQLAMATDPAARAQLQQQEQRQRVELARDTEVAQTALQSSQRQLQLELRDLLKPVLEDPAKGQDVKVVLNADLAVVWGAAELDLTTEVVRRLNARTTPAP